MAKTIAFDLRALQVGHENRGIGMVARSILENIEDDTNEYLFYIFDSSNPIESLGIDLKIANYSFVKTPTLKTVVAAPFDLVDSYRLRYHRFTPLRRHKPDVFLQFDFALGIPKWRRTKTLCIGYDLIPLIMKNQYLPSLKTVWNQPAGKKAKIKRVIRALYYEAKARKEYSNFKRADKILCISEATKQSFLDILHIKADRLKVLYLAPVIPKATADSKRFTEKPYLFYIGGTDYRKHVADIVQAFNIAKGHGSDIALVLAGNEFKETTNIPDVSARNAILSSPYRDDIHLAGFVSDNQKKSLYENALAFIFCSAYEGFGLPVLEAQAMGCPVISYNNSSIPEVSSQAVQLVDNGNIVDVAKGIESIMNKDRELLTKEGVAFAKQFSWKRYVSELLILIKSDA